ncbi:MAG: ATP-binding protein [bacterium]|nr:ATP-binding protein [bacterium]
MMIEREISHHLKDLSDKYPVVTVTGPRQSGKTTFEDPGKYTSRIPGGQIHHLWRQPDRKQEWG